jgi:hypothetical protein
LLGLYDIQERAKKGRGEVGERAEVTGGTGVEGRVEIYKGTV